MNDHQHHQTKPSSDPGSRGRIVLFVFIGIAAFFLLTEHRAHVFEYLPFILLLACPLLHMFMHGGHGGHGAHGGHAHGRRDEPLQDQAQQTTNREAGK
ncbi:DUF2933 domain-containing protein [Ramlibacter sp. PS3R-8]|uniref:DUF2933 domain-containing protein n=1 Tax=Ramlibacter sp. PS3R-8 TaxID=3133437 RepID=UPI00403F2C2C